MSAHGIRTAPERSLRPVNSHKRFSHVVVVIRDFEHDFSLFQVANAPGVRPSLPGFDSVTRGCLKIVIHLKMETLSQCGEVPAHALMRPRFRPSRHNCDVTAMSPGNERCGDDIRKRIGAELSNSRKATPRNSGSGPRGRNSWHGAVGRVRI